MIFVFSATLVTFPFNVDLWGNFGTWDLEYDALNEYVMQRSNSTSEILNRRFPWSLVSCVEWAGWRRKCLMLQKWRNVASNRQILLGEQRAKDFHHQPSISPVIGISQEYIPGNALEIIIVKHCWMVVFLWSLLFWVSPALSALEGAKPYLL